MTDNFPEKCVINWSRMVFFLLLQDNKNLKLESEMRKKGVLNVSGADAGWRSITDHEELYLQLVQHKSGLSHSQVTAVDTQEVTMEPDEQRAGPVIVPADSVQSTSQKLQ